MRDGDIPHDGKPRFFTGGVQPDRPVHVANVDLLERRTWERGGLPTVVTDPLLLGNGFFNRYIATRAIL